MRSQSALMVLPYDAALFMAIHIWVAACLGGEPGPAFEQEPSDRDQKEEQHARDQSQSVGTGGPRGGPARNRQCRGACDQSAHHARASQTREYDQNSAAR